MLEERVRGFLQQQGWGNFTGKEQVRRFLNAMLVAKQGVLVEAQKKALAAQAREEDAGELPEALEFEQPVTQSPRNIYGIYPPKMNSWEMAFAQNMDAAPASNVQWWHRNEPHKAHSVSVVLPSGRRFFPDFIISIQDRPKKDGILMADPKYAWEKGSEHAKALVEHPCYGRSLIVYKSDDFGWQSVIWDPKTQKPAPGSLWDWQNAAGY